MRNRRRWLGVLASTALVLGMSVAVGPPALAASPSNDDFANAIALPSTTSGSTTASSLDATMQTGEMAYDTYTGATVWWTWTAPSSGTYLFDTCGSNFATEIALWSGTAVTSLSLVPATERGCYYQGNWYTNTAMEFTATEGETYDVQVGGDDGGAMGDVVLRWWLKGVPANDNFADATPLPETSSGRIQATNRFSSSEADEPSWQSGRGSVWWTWKAPSDGSYRFDTCGSSTDTRLGIYTGTELASLTQIVTGDDDCAWQSQATFTAMAGTTYDIEVSGYGNLMWDLGDVTLTWKAVAAPANDSFADAAALPETTSGSVTGDNRFATTEGSEPAGMDGRSIWWTWTAPQSGSMVFDTCGTDHYGTLYVGEGTALADLQSVAPPNSYGCFLGANVRFDAVSGHTYVIAASTTEVGGDVPLHWALGTAPANDDFASATDLSGSGGTATGSTMFSTAEVGEPSGYLHTVWFTWAAPDDARVAFDTCGSALPDSHVDVYTGTSVSGLTEVPTALNTTCGGQSRGFDPVPRAVYRIAVTSGDDGMGSFALHWPASGTPAVAPVVTTHPSSTTVASGVAAEFTAAASGDPTPDVQWQVSSTSGSTWSNLAGENATTLSVPTTYAKDGYQYRAVFSNVGGSATTDAATLTVTPLSPAVTTQPSNVTVGAGATAQFTAAASGDPAPTVQWQRSTDAGSTWDDVSGATSGTLTIGSTTLAMNGYQYRAVFSNVGSDTTSNAVTLTVADPATATVTGLVASVSKGSITITFQPSGTPTPTAFQCMLSGGGAKLTSWTACTSGFKVKSGGKLAYVHAGWSSSGPWGTAVSVSVTKG